MPLSGCAASWKSDGKELARDQVGIGDLPGTHRDVDAFLHEVDEAIGEDQVERNVRVALEEAARARATEACGRGRSGAVTRIVPRGSVVLSSIVATAVSNTSMASTTES